MGKKRKQSGVVRASKVRKYRRTARSPVAEPADGLTFLEIFPREILFLIFSYLSNVEKAKCRLVQKQWRSIIDYGVGLDLVVNDKVRGNTHFIERVKIRHLKVLSLRFRHAMRLEFNCFHDSLRKMTLHGDIDMSWLARGPATMRNLTEMAITWDLLKIANLTNPIRVGQSIEDDFIIFPYLKKLTFLLRDSQKFNRMDGSLADTISFGRNLCYFLTHLKCSVLATFEMQYHYLAIPTRYNFTAEPMRFFISNHAKFMKHLMLQGFSLDFQMDLKKPTLIPAELETLHIKLSIAHDDGALDENSLDAEGFNGRSYWKHVLSRQRNLRNLEFYICHHVWRWEIIEVVCGNNSTTLTNLTLAIDWVSPNPVDFSIFAPLCCLASFSFCIHVGNLNRYRAYRQPPSVHVSSLPPSIRDVRLTNIKIHTNEILLFKNQYKYLRHLKMIKVGIRDPFGVNERALRNLLKIRSLNALTITDFNGIYWNNDATNVLNAEIWYGCLVSLRISSTSEPVRNRRSSGLF